MDKVYVIIEKQWVLFGETEIFKFRVVGAFKNKSYAITQIEYFNSNKEELEFWAGAELDWVMHEVPFVS